MSKAKEVTDHMFASAAERLADYVTPEQIAAGQLYPNLSELRNISLKVRAAPGPAALNPRALKR